MLSTTGKQLASFGDLPPIAKIKQKFIKKFVPYSRKIWRFGGLYYNRQIKIHRNFLLAYIRTAKFKSTNILAIAILGSTAKFNSHQYSSYNYGSIVYCSLYTYNEEKDGPGNDFNDPIQDFNSDKKLSNG